MSRVRGFTLDRIDDLVSHIVGHPGGDRHSRIPGLHDALEDRGAAESRATCKGVGAGLLPVKSKMPPPRPTPAALAPGRPNAKAPAITDGLIEIKADGGLKAHTARGEHRDFPGVHADVRLATGAGVRRQARSPSGTASSTRPSPALPARGMPLARAPQSVRCRADWKPRQRLVEALEMPSTLKSSPISAG
jgi:hypothetical protein